jgi:hypothetical protein
MRPLVQSSVGWLLMSTHNDADVERFVRRANIAIQKPSERVKVDEMVQKVASLRGLPTVYTEGVPFAGGATICALLPVTIHGQPVAFGLGGALDRMRSHKARYTAALRRALGTLQ